MKKYLILITVFCFCFSLVAAEGETGQEKEQRSSWTVENLFYGPMLLATSPLFVIPSVFHYGLIGPLVIPLVAIDGAVHTATFGVFAHPEKGVLDDLLILRLLLSGPSIEEEFEKGVAKYQEKAEKGNAQSIACLSDVYYDYCKDKWWTVLVEKRRLFLEPQLDRQKYEQEKQEYLKIKSETLKWLDKAVKAGEEKALCREDHKKAESRYDLIKNIADPWDWNDEEWEKNPTYFGDADPWTPK